MNEETKNWQTEKEGLYRKFTFETFDQAKSFIKNIFIVAEELNHHPKLLNDYNQVEIWLSTHSANNEITQADHEMAERINNFAELAKPVEKKSTDLQIDIDKKLPIKIFTDGGSRGNPGPSAGAYLLLSEDDSVIEKSGYYLGITTNNQAEYQALRHGLERAHQLGFSRIIVYMDSLLVVNQMKGLFKVKNRDLWPIYESTNQLSKNFADISYNHIPRELNKVADEEVNRILDEQ